ncbi:MAG: DUF4411 family protein [Angustibacter sp.]
MYLLDSDVFIQAKNGHYAFDIVPAWWDWVEQAHRIGKVFTVAACREEILAGSDELAEWMKAQPASFALKPQPDDQSPLQRLSEWAVRGPYQQGAAAQFLNAGDYFLVGQALALGYSVVTHEQPARSLKKIKIPDACDAVDVPWMAPWRMLRDEGARFRL